MKVKTNFVINLNLFDFLKEKTTYKNEIIALNCNLFTLNDTKDSRFKNRAYIGFMPENMGDNYILYFEKDGFRNFVKKNVKDNFDVEIKKI